MKKRIIFIFLLIGIISFSVAKKSDSGFYILNESELSRLFGNDEGCRGIGMLFLSEAMINKKNNDSLKLRDVISNHYAILKMKESVLTTRGVIANYLKKINWNTSYYTSIYFVLYFQSICSKLNRSDVKEFVPEVENILSENNLINIDYASENNTSSKGDEIFNMLFKKNNNENSERKIKIISQNDVIATATIGNSKYNLYPTRDIEITAIQRPNLNYTVNLNSGVNKNSVGKVVGTYIATDGTLTYSGELIMK